MQSLDKLIKKYKQHEVDFVLPRQNGDQHVYLDLYLLYLSPDSRWQEVQALIYQYFNYFLEKYRKNLIKEQTILEKLHFPEVPYVALGHCKKGIIGKGTGKERAHIIKDNIFDNENVRKVGLSALADMSIAIGGLGPDLLSDLVSNFAMRHLLDYTQELVQMYDLETRPFPIDRALTVKNFEWAPIPRVELPFFKKNGEPRIFVPVHLVRRLPLLTTNGFYENFLKYVLREEEQDRLNSQRTIGRKPKVPKATIVEIAENLEKRYGTIGDATRTIALERPELIGEYLKDPLRFKKIYGRKKKENIDWSKYKKALSVIEPGNENAHKFAREIKKIFTALYSGQLTTGKLNKKSVDGIYFYDITFGNASETKFFQFLKNQNIKAGVVIFEAKNYGKTKIANNAYNQASSYTILGGRELTFIVGRDVIVERDIERAKRHFLSKKTLIIPLSDEDIYSLLEKREGDPNNFDSLIMERAQEIMEV